MQQHNRRIVIFGGEGELTVKSQRGAARNPRQPSSLIHIQTATSLHVTAPAGRLAKESGSPTLVETGNAAVKTLGQQEPCHQVGDTRPGIRFAARRRHIGREPPMAVQTEESVNVALLWNRLTPRQSLHSHPNAG